MILIYLMSIYERMRVHYKYLLLFIVGSSIQLCSVQRERADTRGKRAKKGVHVHGKEGDKRKNTRKGEGARKERESTWAREEGTKRLSTCAREKERMGCTWARGEGNLS